MQVRAKGPRHVRRVPRGTFDVPAGGRPATAAATAPAYDAAAPVADRDTYDGAWTRTVCNLRTVRRVLRASYCVSCASGWSVRARAFAILNHPFRKFKS